MAESSALRHSATPSVLSTVAHAVDAIIGSGAAREALLAARAGAEAVAGLDTCAVGRFDGAEPRLWIVAKEVLAEAQVRETAQGLADSMAGLGLAPVPDVVSHEAIAVDWAGQEQAERTPDWHHIKLHVCNGQTAVCAFGAISADWRPPARHGWREALAIIGSSVALFLGTRGGQRAVQQRAERGLRLRSTAELCRLAETEARRALQLREELALMLLQPVRLGPAPRAADTEALAESVGELIASSIRDTDILGELEDGTFALVMPRTPARNALIAAHRINARLSSRAFMHSGEAFDLRLTVGVSGVSEGVSSGMDLLEQAEKALFEATRAGPGCSFIAI
jgi:hypothetical protein